MFRPIPFALVFAGLSALACSGLTPTPVPSDKLDYVGDWSGGPVTLSIEAGGMLHYKKDGGGTSTSLDAPIQDWHDKGFDAGIGPAVTTFEVSKAPKVDGSTWKMTVDDQELTRPAAPGEGDDAGDGGKGHKRGGGEKGGKGGRGGKGGKRKSG